MMRRQAHTLQKVEKTGEVSQAQHIDVPVWQILDETIAVLKLAPHERVQQRTLEQVVDVPVATQRQVLQVQLMDKVTDVRVVFGRGCGDASC